MAWLGWDLQIHFFYSLYEIHKSQPNQAIQIFVKSTIFYVFIEILTEIALM